jgi:hypothetical protein
MFQVDFFESQCVFLLHAMECLRLVCFGFWVRVCSVYVEALYIAVWYV